MELIGEDKGLKTLYNHTAMIVTPKIRLTREPNQNVMATR